MNKCCGNCRYSKYKNGEWICTNEESEGFGLKIAYDDLCEECEVEE